MNLIQRFLRKDARAKAQRTRALRAEEIEDLGLRLVDRSGWFEGKYSPKAYLLERDGEVVAGPFSSSSEALQAARRLSIPEG